jgi:bidirectional [NiFe] hydrogenase diaphorase subunit
MNIVIDRQIYQAREGETVLQVARRHELASIPSLCYHPALRTEGACRMCMVEVDGEHPALTTACSLEASEGLQIWTDTQAVRQSRRQTLFLLLKRAPGSMVLNELAKIYKLEASAKNGNCSDQRNECISCGLCVKVCEVLGIQAIQFTGKGKDRRVRLILQSGESSCIGCQACVRICASRVMEKGHSTSILELDGWLSGLAQATCKVCGRPYATQAAVRFVASQVPATRARIDLCPECKRAASIPRRLIKQ